MSIDPEITSHPPEPQRCDRRICEAGGITTALSMTMSSLMIAKQQARNCEREAKEVELVRLNCAYRQECMFFRICYDSAKKLVDDVWNISQVLMLNYYFDSDATSRVNDEAFKRAEELQEAVHRHEKVVCNAEEDWVKFWYCERKRSEEGRI